MFLFKVPERLSRLLFEPFSFLILPVVRVSVVLSIGLVAMLFLTTGPVWGVDNSAPFETGSAAPAAAPSETRGSGLAAVSATQTVTETVPQQQSGWAGGESQTGQQEQSGWSGEIGQTPQPQPPATGVEPAASAQVPILPDWPLLVLDDFSDPATGWLLWNDDKPLLGSFTDGTMQVAFEAEPDTRRSPFSVHEFQDFRVDVDVRTVGLDEDVFYGLLLRYGGSYEEISYYYYFRIQADGSYIVFLRDGQESTILHQAPPSSCIFTGPGTVNHLTAVAEGYRMDFYANGCYLTSVSDDRLAEGDIGVAAGRSDTVGPVDVRFDNFRVYAQQPHKPVAWGDVSNSLLDKDELIARGEFLHLWPFPAESITQFPGGTKKVELYVLYEGMTSAHQVTEVAFVDGQELWREGPLPWAHHVAAKGHLGFGVLNRDYHMREGSDLPTGHWEVRNYVDDVLVARTFFSVGVDTPPPAPEPLEIRSAPPLPPPSLPPAEESFGHVVDLYLQGRYTETLPYCELAMAVAPNSTQLMLESAKCYEASGMPGRAQMLRQTADNLASKRADVPQGTGPMQEQVPSASPVPPAQPTTAAPAAPQPAAQPTAVALPSLPYSDDFSDPNSGWPVSANERNVREYRDGEYSLTVLVEGGGTWSFLPESQLIDFTMEADMRRVGDVEDDYSGFIFGYVDSSNYYEVSLSRQSTYRVKKTVEGKPTYIRAWTKAPALQPGQATNHLKVTRQGDQIAIFVNNQHLATVRDPSFTEGQAGQVGLVTRAFKDKPNAQAAFDNFKLTTAENVPPPLFAPLPLVDDFSDPNSGWPVESDDKRTQEYRDGEYHIHIPGDSYWTSSVLPDARWGDFTAEVDIRQVSDVEDDAGGFILRRVDGNNFYEVSISPRGFYRIRKRVGGTYMLIQAWTKSEAVLLGQATNRLKVICNGDQMAVFVNGQHLTTVRDKAFMQGQVGLRAEAFNEKPSAHLAFDNFMLSAAGDVPPHPQGQLPLDDDFSDLNSGWPTLDDDYADRGYRDGAYHYLTKSGRRSWSLLQDKTFADFSLEVDATKIGGPEGGEYGVLFRALGHKDFYMFQVSPDGTISVQRKVGGEYTDLLPWQATTYVNPGQATNRLKVVCQDTDCAVHVNDQQVAAFADDTFLQGQVGFVVGHSHNAGGTEVTFDNLRVSAP